MIAEKNAYGYWVVSDILNGERIQKTYIFYTKKEAVRMFKNSVFGTERE